MEIGSLSGLEQACSSIVIFATDLGTEALISEFQSLDCTSMILECLAAGAMQPDIVTEDDFANSLVAVGSIFRYAIAVLVSLRLLRTVSKGISQHLTHWGHFYAQLQVLEALLNNRPRRERFVGLCID